MTAAAAPAPPLGTHGPGGLLPIHPPAQGGRKGAIRAIQHPPSEVRLSKAKPRGTGWRPRHWSGGYLPWHEKVRGVYPSSETLGSREVTLSGPNVGPRNLLPLQFSLAGCSAQASCGQSRAVPGARRGIPSSLAKHFIRGMGPAPESPPGYACQAPEAPGTPWGGAFPALGS